jgi:hypothetical protein
LFISEYFSSLGTLTGLGLGVTSTKLAQIPTTFMWSVNS